MNAYGAEKKESYPKQKRYITYSMLRSTQSLHCVSTMTTEGGDTETLYRSATTATTEHMNE